MIPLLKPYMPPLPELNSILHSGVLACGHYTHLFENELIKYLNEPYVLATNSFASAISVALTTLGLTFGDEVIASPMACLASTQPLITQGMAVVWADVNPLTGSLSPYSVRQRISSRTKLIFHNHYCGILGQIDEINSIGKEYGIPVIDDGIEAFGSIYMGNRLGHTGTDVTVFSFSAVRSPNTIDGGAVVFRDRGMYERAILVRDAGIDRKRFRDEMGEIDPSCDISIPGLSATMSNANGYIGLCQMAEIEELIKKQRANAKMWDQYFRGNNEVRPITLSESIPNYWIYGVLANDKQTWLKIFREKGYYASGVHVNNSKYSVFGKAQYELPGVEQFSNGFLALPCGWWMEGVDIK
jgi:dTDP-4-amino-4,6-dideoxygalactose transaminase